MPAAQGSPDSVTISGREVVLVEVLMTRYLPRDRPLMSAADREGLSGVLRVLRRARKAYECADAEEMSDIGHADMTSVELPEESTHDHEIGTAEAARVMDVSQRHAARLAAEWAREGLARREGGAWLTAVTAVEAYRDNPKRRSA